MDHSPLRTLPPELRNAVYEFILPSPLTFTIHNKGPYGGKAKLKKVKVEAPVDTNIFALGKTCRILQSEYTPLLYATATFSFNLRDVYYCHQRLYDLDCFKREVGKTNAAALRNVTLDSSYVFSCSIGQVDKDLRETIEQLRRRSAKSAKLMLRLKEYHSTYTREAQQVDSVEFAVDFRDFDRTCDQTIQRLLDGLPSVAMRNAVAEWRRIKEKYGDS